MTCDNYLARLVSYFNISIMWFQYQKRYWIICHIHCMRCLVCAYFVFLLYVCNSCVLLWSHLWCCQKHLYKWSIHYDCFYSPHVLTHAFRLQRGLDMHLSNHCSLSSAAPPLLHDLPKTSALHCGDPITLNRLQTDIENTALWENASFPSAVHHCILITGRGLEENWCTKMTILWAATQQFSFYAPASLIYPTCCASVKAGSSVYVRWMYWGK